MDLGSYEHTGLIVACVFVFFAMRLAIGYWASRMVSTAADYLVAGRRLPLYIASASIMATWFAAEALMGASDQAYRYGFQGVVFDPFGAALCLLVSGLFFIRLMRRAKYLTVVDFFERRYGPEMSVLASFGQLATYFAWTASQFVAGGLIAQALFGWPPAAGMIVVGAVVTAYTTMGGMWADTLLDFIQMFFTAAGITVVFVCVLKAVGGWEGLVTDAASAEVSQPFTLLPIAGEEGFLGYTGWVGWSYWIAAWLSLGLGSIACQDLMQRSMSARNEATSVWGSYCAAGLYLFFGVMSPLIGIMMYKLSPELADQESQNVLMRAAIYYVPSPLLTGVFIAALASALMSTSDSSILAGASVTTENILPFFWPGMTDAQKLRWTRIMVVVNGSISLGIAVAIATIYKLATVSWAILLVGLFAPFAFGMYWKKANRSGAIASFFGGFLTWIVCVPVFFLNYTKAANTGADGVLSLDDAVWDAVYIGCTPAVAVSVLAMVVVSLLTQRSDPPQSLTDVNGEPLPLRRRLGLLPPRDML